MPNINIPTNADFGQQKYNDPAGGSESSIGKQINDYLYKRKAIVDIKRKQYYGQFADAETMP